jgi:hypothetical protein
VSFLTVSREIRSGSSVGELSASPTDAAEDHPAICTLRRTDGLE